MTKTEYLSQLQTSLRRGKVIDADDILEEYRQHFDFKMAEGYTEEEISAKLGDPSEIAAQYDSGNGCAASPAYRNMYGRCRRSSAWLCRLPYSTL